MKNIRYLCNMKTKNLYMNNGEPMCKALVINGKCPPPGRPKTLILKAS